MRRFTIGRAPLVLGLVSWVAAIPMVSFRVVWAYRDPYGDPVFKIWEMLLASWTFVVSLLLALAGLVLGIKRLVRGERNRRAAAIGTALSAVLLVGFLILGVYDELTSQ